MKDEKKYWLDEKRNWMKIVYALVSTCVILVLLDLVIGKHAHFGVDGWFGFYGFYGYLGSVGLVMVSKEVLRRIVMRPEDYYDDDE